MENATKMTAYTIRSENLDWVKSERRFHTDASTLFMLPGMPMPRRLEVVSAHTGESAFFNLTDRSEAGWFYKPDPICRHSSATLGVMIWNT